MKIPSSAICEAKHGYKLIVWEPRGEKNKNKEKNLIQLSTDLENL